MDNLSALIVGNLTIDENIEGEEVYTGPGGSAYFCAKILSNLHVRTTVVSPYGPDFPKMLLQNTSFIPTHPRSDETLAFRNTYNSGNRKQQVYNQKDYIWPDLDLDLQDIFLVAPVLDNYKIEKLKYLLPGEVLKILLPQGFFRQVGKNSKIISKKWEPDNSCLNLFDFIILSEEDYEGIEKEAFLWSNISPTVILTRAEKGCSVFQKGQACDFHGFKTKNIADVTGAGDVFAASFAYAYCRSKNLETSIEFANASAALSLRYRSNQLKYNYSDIIEFAKAQGRVIRL